MLEALQDALTFFPRGLVYVVLGVVVLLLAKLARDLTTGHRIDDEVVEKGNLAEALRLSGYFFGGGAGVRGGGVSADAPGPGRCRFRL